MKLNLKWGRKHTSVTVNDEKFTLRGDHFVARDQVLMAIEQKAGRRLRYDEWLAVARTPVIDQGEDGSIEV